MNDETTIIAVVVGTLAVFVFVETQMKTRKVSRQHSFGDTYQPAPTDKERSDLPHW